MVGFPDFTGFDIIIPSGDLSHNRHESRLRLGRESIQSDFAPNLYTPNLLIVKDLSRFTIIINCNHLNLSMKHSHLLMPSILVYLAKYGKLF